MQTTERFEVLDDEDNCIVAYCERTSIPTRNMNGDGVPEMGLPSFRLENGRRLNLESGDYIYSGAEFSDGWGKRYRRL